MTVRGPLAVLASDGREARTLVEDLFASILAALRRDPRFSGIALLDLELVLADARRDAEESLFFELRNRVRLEDAEDLVHRMTGED
jgi:hypothetical protein